MSLLVDPPFGLGQTLGVSSTDDGTGWVGVVKQFPDVDPTTGQVRSNRIKTCIAVRNTSGTTLYGKRLVNWAAGSFSAVDAYSRQTNDRPAGVTDEHLSSAGVAANDVFWLTVEGPSEMSSGGVVAADNLLVAKTAAAGGATDSTLGGKAVVGNATTAAEAMGLVGRAISAAAGADVDILTVVSLGR